MISSKEAAKAAVDDWLVKNDGGRFRYEHLSVNRETSGWIVLLATFSFEGDEIGGPAVFLADPVSGDVSTPYA